MNLSQKSIKEASVKYNECPVVYEEMICSLEQEVRKHIKIE